MEGKGGAAVSSKHPLRRCRTAASLACLIVLAASAAGFVLITSGRIEAGHYYATSQSSVRLTSMLASWAASDGTANRTLSNGTLPLPVARGRTLVLYTYGGQDPEYPENFRFFVQEAVRDGDNCDYILVLQEGEGVAPVDPLPVLPPNARYLRHPNSCFDFGTIGWVLDTKVSAAQLKAYEYFVWLNPSVRGPFLPTYVRGQMHWTEPFISRLSPTVKLVGSSINCVGPGGKIPPSGPPIHVQTYVAATDWQGLEVLRATGTVFKCWKDMRSVIERSELGASAAIFAAGYTIDSLMFRYQGVDWRDPAVIATACNDGRNPVNGPDWNGGISVHPMETLFVKLKAPMLKNKWPAAQAAAKYAEWSREVAKRQTAAAAKQGRRDRGTD